MAGQRATARHPLDNKDLPPGNFPDPGSPHLEAQK
jgi:hypothetical protein